MRLQNSKLYGKKKEKNENILSPCVSSIRKGFLLFFTNFIYDGWIKQMGLTVLEIEVGSPSNPEITEKVEFLIDSGAVYSVVPAQILEKLKIKPIAKQEFRLADGSKIVRNKGIALFKYKEQLGGADVIFGEEGDSQLLGAFTLEALGLALDPIRRELKPLPMLLAYQVFCDFGASKTEN